MKHLLFLLSILLLTLVGCSNEVDYKSGSRNVINPDAVSEDEAKERAEMYMNMFFGKTRGHELKIKTTQTIRSNKTRSAEDGRSDILAYLINYENEDGFALMSGDKNTVPVLAISEEGNLDLSDTVFNEGLRTFVKGIGSSDIYRPIDTLAHQDPMLPITYDYGTPMLAPNVRKWGQDLPFNIQCPINYSKQGPYLVGCVALSMGQIMSHFEWPTVYDGTAINWNEIKNDSWGNSAAYLLMSLGKKDNLNTDYRNDGSWAESKYIAPTFRNFGYKMDDKPTAISDWINTYLLDDDNPARKPLLVAGYDEQSSLGHAWVIDGFIRTNYPSTMFVDGIARSEVLVHCVWGFYGKANGYYLCGKRKGYIGGDRVSTDSEDGQFNGYSDADSFYWFGGNPGTGMPLRYWSGYSK